MSTFRYRKEDGTVITVEYKRTPVEEQMKALRAYANKRGWRQSEIAMYLGNFVSHPKQRLDMYKYLVASGEVKQ